MMRNNIDDGEAIGSKWLSKAIETAQKKVEARNYDIRKQVVEYDDVMNDQRKVIYEQRADIMDADTVGDVVEDMRAETVNAVVGEACPPNSYPEQWDVEGMKAEPARKARHRAVDRRVGQGSRGRSRDDRGAGRAKRPTRMSRAKVAELDPRFVEPGREVDPAPEPGSSLEGASGDARCAAPGRAPARLCAEDADQRI